MTCRPNTTSRRRLCLRCTSEGNSSESYLAGLGDACAMWVGLDHASPPQLQRPLSRGQSVLS
eukprot:8282-Eustigmatos_ZCMA.PRE.1